MSMKASIALAPGGRKRGQRHGLKARGKTAQGREKAFPGTCNGYLFTGNADSLQGKQDFLYSDRHEDTKKPPLEAAFR